MDEAMHPLALLCFGMYGEELPNQDGAPLRLVVPWKYGFKSIKAIVRIRFTEKQPLNTWKSRQIRTSMASTPTLIRTWIFSLSQASERRLGEFHNVPPYVQRIRGSGREPLQRNGFEEELLVRSG